MDIIKKNLLNIVLLTVVTIFAGFVFVIVPTYAHKTGIFAPEIPKAPKNYADLTFWNTDKIQLFYDGLMCDQYNTTLDDDPPEIIQVRRACRIVWRYLLEAQIRDIRARAIVRIQALNLPEDKN